MVVIKNQNNLLFEFGELKKKQNQKTWKEKRKQEILLKA